MAVYILKRIGASVATMFLVICITFFVMNAIPGSPFITENSTELQVAQANEKYGLDKPLVVQLKNYLTGYLHGDMGTSLKMQQGYPVTKIIFSQGKFSLSVRIGVLSLLTAVIIGIPLGCLSAYKRGKWMDGVLSIITTLGIAIPGFVVATLMLIIFAVELNWLPVISGTMDSWKTYIMPVVSIALYPACYVAKLTRTSMLDEINKDYIRTANAKGLNAKVTLFKHTLRNSLIPVVTYLGPLTAGIMTGNFVVETTFGIPGLGKYLVSSIVNRDYPLIMGVTVILAAMIILMNLVVDILYVIVDPRISLGSEEE